MTTTCKKTSPLQQILQELECIPTSRIGHIVKMDEEADMIWVDYEDNPAQVPLPAKLANRWLSLDDLKEAISRKATIQIGFENGNPLKPIIREIFYAISSLKKREKQTGKKQVIHIEADEIILSGRQKVVIQSGSSKTTYLAKGGELTTEADQIHSSASKTQRIKGGSVLLN